MTAVPDQVEVELQLEYARRALEEKEELLSGLRAALASSADEASERARQCAALAEVQDELLRRKHVAESAADAALREKAELAAENARLHVFARDAAARAEAASRRAAELRALIDARERADATVAADSADASDPIAQVAAARALAARALAALERAGVAPLQPVAGASMPTSAQSASTLPTGVQAEGSQAAGTASAPLAVHVGDEVAADVDRANNAEPSGEDDLDDVHSKTEPHTNDSVLAPLAQPFVRLGQGFWSTLVGDDCVTSPRPSPPRDDQRPPSVEAETSEEAHDEAADEI